MTMRARAKRWAWVIASFAITPSAWAQTPGGVPIPDDPSVRAIEQLADAPAGVDYAKVQTAVEPAANPSFDGAAFNAELEHWNWSARRSRRAQRQPT